MNRLDSATIRNISSAQVITGVDSIVKELVENSLDASATNIQVKLENFGLDRIEVRDNGDGIPRQSAPYVALPHYTTKLQHFEDLERIGTYGFRGEALASLAAVSELTVCTCTGSDALSTVYSFDHSGCVTREKPSSLGQGTSVIVTGLFQNIPVRKQLYKNGKKCRGEFKRVEDVLLSFGLAHPGIRMVLRHNGNLIWQKPEVHDFTSSARAVFGFSLMQNLDYFEFEGSREDEIHQVESDSQDNIEVEENLRCRTNRCVEGLSCDDQLTEEDVGNCPVEDSREEEECCDEETGPLYREGNDLDNARTLVEGNGVEDVWSFKTYGLLPKEGADSTTTSRSTPDRLFLFVNRRPVYMKPVVKVIRKVLQENNLLPANKFPVGCVFLSLPSADIDVNVEPNKIAVYFKNADCVIKLLTRALTEFYGTNKSHNHSDDIPPVVGSENKSPGVFDGEDKSPLSLSTKDKSLPLLGGVNKSPPSLSDGNKSPPSLSDGNKSPPSLNDGNKSPPSLSDGNKSPPSLSGDSSGTFQGVIPNRTASNECSLVHHANGLYPSNRQQNQEQTIPMDGSDDVCYSCREMNNVGSSKPPQTDSSTVNPSDGVRTECGLGSGESCPEPVGVGVDSQTPNEIPKDPVSKWSLGWSNGNGTNSSMKSASLLSFGVTRSKGISFGNGTEDGANKTIACSSSPTPNLQSIGSGNGKKRRLDTDKFTPQRKRPTVTAASLKSFWKQLSTDCCDDVTEERNLLEWKCDGVALRLQNMEAMIRSQGDVVLPVHVIGTINEGNFWFFTAKGAIFCYNPPSTSPTLSRSQVLAAVQDAITENSENRSHVTKLRTYVAT